MLEAAVASCLHSGGEKQCQLYIERCLMQAATAVVAGVGKGGWKGVLEGRNLFHCPVRVARVGKG